MESSHISQSSNHTLIQEGPVSSDLHFIDNSKAPRLETILSGLSLAPYSRVAFMDFLRKLHCAENLEFLINSNQYLQHFRSAESSDMLLQERHQIWDYIYNTFISEDAPKELNIPHDIKTEYKGRDQLPSAELIELTNRSIQDLLRDVYMQFLQHVKKCVECPHKPGYFSCDKINEQYSLLSTPTEECYCPKFNNFKASNRRMSENCSPLDPASTSFFQSGVSLSTSRCSSPLSSGSDIAVPEVKPRSLSTPRSSTVIYCTSSDDLTSKDKKKLSVSEQSGLKKFAGKLRWRRLSSNSSTGSN